MFVPVGIPGCGKTTHARKYFNDNEIVGLDRCREILAGRLQFNRELNAPAASLLKAHVQALVTVRETIYLDCTNVKRKNRQEYINIAKEAGYQIVYIDFTDSLYLDLCKRRVLKRTVNGGAHIPDFVMENMFVAYQSWQQALLDGDKRDVIINSDTPIIREIPRHILSDEHELVFIGDLHGQAQKLMKMLEEHGARFTDTGRLAKMPGVQYFYGFCGDTCDRGSDSPSVIRIVRDLVYNGRAVCVQGNHDDAVGRMMVGETRKGKSDQSVRTAAELDACHDGQELGKFLNELPLVVHLVHRDVYYLLSHAGVPIYNDERAPGYLSPNKFERIDILKGAKTGERDEENRFLITPPWELRHFDAMIENTVFVYGHLNSSLGRTGEFVVPYIHTMPGGGSKFVCVESQIEKHPDNPVGVYIP